MLKKMVIVVTALMLVTPAFAYRLTDDWNEVKQPAISSYLNAETGEWTTPEGQRTVDWQTKDDYTQRKAEVWNWPASYDFVDVCQIKVKMEIGFWIQLKGCKDSVIKLKQVSITKYRGETSCKVSANVATEWKASWKMTHASLTADRDYVRVDKESGKTGGDGTTAKFTGSEVPYNEKTIYIALGLKKLDLGKTAPTNECMEIGYVTVQVRPLVRPNQFMSGCDASGAGYGGQDYKYYAPPL